MEHPMTDLSDMRATPRALPARTLAWVKLAALVGATVALAFALSEAQEGADPMRYIGVAPGEVPDWHGNVRAWAPQD